MVDAIGIVLRFQTKTAARFISDAVFSLSGRQKVAGIELHTGLIRFHGHGDSRFRCANHRCRGSGKNIIAVIAAAEQDAGFFRIHPLPNGSGLPEIHGRACHRQDLACGQAVSIVDCKSLCSDLQPMIQYGTAAGEIEVGMVGQVQDRIGLCFCLVPEFQHTPVPKDIHTQMQIPGIAFFTIFTKIR